MSCVEAGKEPYPEMSGRPGTTVQVSHECSSPSFHVVTCHFLSPLCGHISLFGELGLLSPSPSSPPGLHLQLALCLLFMPTAIPLFRTPSTLSIFSCIISLPSPTVTILSSLSHFLCCSHEYKSSYPITSLLKISHVS